MLHKVEPLRDELNSLEKAAKENELKARELEEVINQLEKSISQYKLEYAELISQAQIIKSDLNSVESKVERSVALLKSLSNEQTRWDSSSESFKVQMSTIVGDVLLSSALMAYGGYYDQAMRNSLFNTWTSSLHNANIKFKEDLARIEYLSNADERMSWHACSLPTDDLCIENAIMLKRFNRYPLIIDPSGQATEFILNMYKDRKITKTSFLDYSFRKNLESSLRFGNPILIQDVENYDPILNPVLNREIRRTGGRVLITLGDQDIDFSPMFTMFLSTRDPTVEFPPDICSRVTFVNFTVTRASLQAQCLHQVLKCERPDVEEKRLDLLKIQGEFQQRLRHLEKDLLGALNESKGKILNDDTIISRLENLKKEAAEISKKVAETDFVMKEVETVINQYSGLSQACSSIYFTMDVLNQIHTLYQYSLQYFLEIFTTVLTQNANLKDVKDSQQRLKIIARDLFYLAYYRLARGMLHDDRIVLALLLAKIYLKGFMKNNTESASIEGYFRSLMNSNVAGLVESKEDKEKSDKANSLNAEQTEAINYLTKMSDFKNLKSIIRDNSDDFYTWLESANPEKNVPDVLWSTPGNSQAPALATGAFDLAEICNLLKKLLLVKAMRPDRFISIAEMFINNIFGDAFLEQTERMVELANIVENEIKSTTPILMCSVTGYDASGRVEDLAAETNKQLIAIAIGSSEGFTQAEKAINTSSKTGKWVLLKNVHLATQWLVQLEKKLHNLQPHPAFRIFLAMEITPKIPSNLLRLGRCLVFEPPPGIKANLMRTLSVIPVSRMNKVPAERSRLYFLLCWLHAITQERLRYVPLGWSKTYEFNESDIRCGLDTIDVWIDSIAMGRNNLPPSKVPFSAIYTLLSECVYGGKIDNSFDRRLLNTFLKQLFSVGSFEADFRLVTDDLFNLNMPDAVKKEQFLEWIDNLKHQQTPSWLGLPNSAEKVLLAYNCREVVSKLLKLSIMDEEEEELAYDAEAGYKKSDSYEFANKPPSVDSRPSWMKLLNASVCEWLNVLPKSLSGIKRSQDNIKDPLFRFFEREINAGIKLLKTVLNDLSDVVSICEGNKKQTNYHRQILKDLAKGLIPRNWKRYTVPKDLIVQPWILDFSERIRQMAAISKQFNEQGLEALKGYVVWLGGLFTPEAYITATRQYVAQSNSWSLEELQLEMTVYENRNQMKSLDNCSFGLTGLKLQGAVCTNNKVNLSTNIVNNFNISVIKWTRINPASSAPTTSRLNLPIYLNSTRAELLFTINLDTDQNENLFYMRGVAILASSLAG